MRTFSAVIVAIGKKTWKQPKYPSTVQCLNISVRIHSMKFTWPLKITTWINCFESVAENHRAVAVKFLGVPVSLEKLIKNTEARVY